MKSIAPPSPLFQFPNRRNVGSFTDGTINRNTCRSVTVLAKKSKNNNHKQPPSTDSNPSPPRITSNLKHNLPILKELKESEKKKSTPLRPSRYRRKRVDKKEELSDDPPTILHSVESDIEDEEEVPKVLFVDGYNVCGYWPKLKAEFMSGKLDIARQMLIKDLAIFSGINEMEVVVVFDAMKSGLKTRREHQLGVGVVYSGESSADFWIDQEAVICCMEILPPFQQVMDGPGRREYLVFLVSYDLYKVKRLMEGDSADVTVATSDRAIMNETYYKGASVWSCATLISEIEDAYKETEISNQRASIFSKHGSLLKNVLRPGVLDGLKDLKKKLLSQEMKRQTQISREKSMQNGKISKVRRPKVRISPPGRFYAMRSESELRNELYYKSDTKIPTEPKETLIE